MEISRFPNRLKKYRKAFCLSQKQAAKLLGLTDASALSRWEKGVCFPNLVYLFKLSKLYHAFPNEMYFDLWQHVSKELTANENNLLAPQEPFIPNEVYQL
jgi:transcriptional regulator with XRE-family HTH domain